MKISVSPPLHSIALSLSAAIVAIFFGNDSISGQQPPNAPVSPVTSEATSNKAVTDSSKNKNSDDDLGAELPRIQPLEPDRAVESFQILPGFRLELVAAEPLVVDPIAFAWDAKGQLFVIEMRDYSEMSDAHTGQVAMLVDTDHDGVMDRRTTFVEGLSWPTAIACWQDGIIVAHPPYMSYHRDTDNDGKADDSQTWYQGFGRTNVQGMVNSLRWTVNGKIEGATSSTGATLIQKNNLGGSTESDTSTEKWQLRGVDFVLDPADKSLQLSSGGGQHGMSFNRWGDKFVCSNSDHLQQVIDIESYLRRSTGVINLPSTRRSIAEDGPQAEVFRASPIEPWRIVRTRLRVAGTVPGPVEGGGRAAGYFTGATGVWVVDAERGYGDPRYDTALTCDVGSNLIHRKRLIPSGLYYTGQRLDERTELLRSTDIWFRPTQLGDGPDGSVYIADMYREVIEHPASLPPTIKKHLDLNSGNDRGRIWRLLSDAAPKHPFHWDLTSRSDDELVELLGHPFQWQRLTAQRLLIERQAVHVIPLLYQKVATASVAEHRMLALLTAARLANSNIDMGFMALKDAHPRVRSAAIEVLTPMADRPEIAAELALLSKDESPHVQWELAQATPIMPVAIKQKVVSDMLSIANIPLIRSVLFNSVQGQQVELLTELLKSPDLVWTENSSQSAARILESYVQEKLKLGNDPDDRQPHIAMLEMLVSVADKHDTLAERDPQESDPPWMRLASALAAMNNGERETLVKWYQTHGTSGYNSLKQKIDAELVDLDQRWQDLIDETESFQKRCIRAAQWSRLAGRDSAEPILKRLVDSRAPLESQFLAVDATRSIFRTELPDWWFAAMPNLTASVRASAFQITLQSAVSAQQLVDKISAGTLTQSMISAQTRQALRLFPEPTVANSFAEMEKSQRNPEQADIQALQDDILRSLLDGDQATAAQLNVGRIAFERVCANCHRWQGVGNQVGPPLNNLGEKSEQQILQSILEPNREVDPKYIGYQILVDDGRLIAGILKEESSLSVVVEESGGKQQTIPRARIEQMRSSGVSLMPEGLQRELSKEELAALVRFLRQ